MSGEGQTLTLAQFEALDRLWDKMAGLDSEEKKRVPRSRPDIARRRRNSSRRKK